MKKWVAKWIVSAVMPDGCTVSECFDSRAGARIYAKALKDGLPGIKPIIERI